MYRRFRRDVRMQKQIDRHMDNIIALIRQYSIASGGLVEVETKMSLDSPCIVPLHVEGRL